MSLQIRARHVRTNCCKCKYVGVLCCYLAILTGDSVHFESEPLLWLCIMALHHRISEPKSALLPSGGCRYSFHFKKKRNRKAFIQFQISRGQRINGQIHVHVQENKSTFCFTVSQYILRCQQPFFCICVYFLPVFSLFTAFSEPGLILQEGQI